MVTTFGGPVLERMEVWAHEVGQRRRGVGARRAVTDWFDRPLLDLDAVDLDDAPRVDYLLCQRFRYEYDGPAFDVRQRLVAVPRTRHGALHRRAHHVDVTVSERPRGPDGAASTAAATRSSTSRVAEVRRAVEFTVAALVHGDGPLGDTCAAGGRRCATRPPAGRPRSPSRRRAADAGRGAARRDGRRCGVRRGGLRGVQAGIGYGFGGDLGHDHGGGGVGHWSRGVPGLRPRDARGLPRRRRPGPLRLRAPARPARRQPRLGRGARPRRRPRPGARLDPSNGCRAGPRHLPVAVGRDYADVAPTSGRYSGGANGRLTWTKHAGVTAVAEELFANCASAEPLAQIIRVFECRRVRGVRRPHLTHCDGLTTRRGGGRLG